MFATTRPTPDHNPRPRLSGSTEEGVYSCAPMLGTAFAPHALALALTAASLGPVPPPPPSPAAGVTPPPAAGAAGTIGSPAASPSAPVPVTGSATPIDFAPVVQTLARVTACAPLGTVPERFDSQVVENHCKELAALEDKWRQVWLSQAQPFLSGVVPRDLPSTVVYPFGGGDLLTALVTFPNAAEITTLSLESAGDPRAIDALSPADLEPMLAEVRDKVNHLFHYGHSKTVDMVKMAKSKLPGDLTYALVALEMNQLDPVAVRFFHLDAGGRPVYLSQDDLGESGVPRTTRAAFGSIEIQFVARGGGARRTFRHIAVNLDDRHMRADPSVLRHLELKGPVAAMTKAASYLLWWKDFGLIRGYLLKNMVWMISDSTGIPPDDAQAHGFEQIPYGRFDGPFLGGGIRPAEVFRKLWADKAQPLAFRFGYPDIGNHDHLLITRRLPR